MYQDLKRGLMKENQQQEAGITAAKDETVWRAAGLVEVLVDDVTLLNAVSGPLPLPISEAAAAKAAAGALREELRLENRVLDLRCAPPQSEIAPVFLRGGVCLVWSLRGTPAQSQP